MKKHTDTIVINGRSYHAGTGELLSHAPHTAPAPPAHHRSEHKAVPVSQPAIPIQTPASRRPARHVAAHQRTRARTLMRQGVKKPGPSVKRRARVQGYLDAPIRPHAVPGRSHTAARHPAAKTAKGQLISHFSPQLFAVEHITLLIEPAAPAVQNRPVAEPTRRRPLTTDELLEFAVQQARTPIEPLRRKRRLFHGHTGVR